MIIATRDICASQNSYGFTSRLKFENIVLRLAREGLNIENCFGTIDGLLEAFNCTEGIFASQNSYGFRAILSRKKLCTFVPGPGGF